MAECAAGMPKSPSFRVGSGQPSEAELELRSALINGHSRNDVESIIGSRGGPPGEEEEFLVQWMGSSESCWVPAEWVQLSLLGRGKVMEYQDNVQQRIFNEKARTIQRGYRQYRTKAYEAAIGKATLKAQAIHRGNLTRKRMEQKRIQLQAQKIENEARAVRDMELRAAEVSAKKRKEERDAKKAEEMRVVREQAQKLIEQQGGARIDPNAPLRKLESPRTLGPIARLPRSPRSQSARSGGMKPGKMNYDEYVAALDLHLHRQRVNTIRPAVDTVAPPEFNHLKEKLKFKQLELEKGMHIANENNWLARRVDDMPTLALGEPPKKAKKIDATDPTQAFNAKMQQLEHQQHRRRVRRMRHAVDADSPKRYKHLQENLKGKQNQEDRRLEMERNNRAMQARLASMQPLSLRQDSKSSANASVSTLAKQSSMASSAGSRSSRASSKDFQAYLLEMDKKLLRERVQSMQPDVNTDAPPVYKHLQQNLKGKQLFQEKEAEIKRLNKIMHERVANTTSISKFTKVPNMSRRSGPELSWAQKMEKACMHGDEPMLNQALKHVDPSAVLTGGWFPVALCSASGQLGVLRALLRIAHGDAERKISDGSTPLRLAAARGHADCVDALLKAHAESDIVISCQMAAENGHLDVMQVILNHRVELLLTVPHDALYQLRTKVQKNTPNIAALPQHLRNCFRRIEARFQLLETFANAAKTGNTQILRKCLHNPGLNPEVLFRTGWNALGLAAAGDHSDAVVYLLSQGAQIEAPMSDGRSALEIATQAGNIDVATLLIEKKSKLEEQMDADEAEVLSSRSARKLKKIKPPACDGTALVPKPPPKRSVSTRTAKTAGSSSTGPRKYNWECGETEGQTLLFGAVSAVGAAS